VHKTGLVIILAILVTVCQSKNRSSDSSENKTISSDSVEILLSIEKNDVIANPVRITSTPEGFALYDKGFHQIKLFTENGKPLLSFGQEGKGPGEFQSVSAIKSFSDQIIVSDSELLLQYSFDLDGNLVSTTEIASTLYAIDNEIVTPGAFVSPTSGMQNSLAFFSDKNREINYHFGEPVVKAPKAADFNKWQKEFSQGKVPDFFRNRVGISADQSRIYLFLQTEGILQQYDLKGKLKWEKSFNLPEFNDEFDRFIKENKDNEPGKVYMLQYVYDMEQDEIGVYMLLRIPHKYPVTILFIGHDGKNIKFYKFNNIEHRPSRFSISPDKEWIYFLNTSRGVVYRNKWPE